MLFEVMFSADHESFNSCLKYISRLFIALLVAKQHGGNICTTKKYEEHEFLTNGHWVYALRGTGNSRESKLSIKE